MSKEYNSAGRTLVVDEIIEVGSTFNKKTSQLQQMVEKSVMRRNYSSTVQSIKNITSDNYVSPNEKLSLYRELNSIRSSYSSLMNQGNECGFSDASSESYQIYFGYLHAFSELNAYVTSIVADISIGQVVDGTTLASKFVTYYQASAALEDEVFYVLNKQQETLSLILSATSFSYDAYGVIKSLVDDQGNPIAQEITVYSTQNGIGEELVMEVNGVQVEHSFGEYTITPESMVGRTFILVKVTCGNLVRSNIIMKVLDGGDSVDVKVYSSNGSVFRIGTCYTTLSAKVWRGKNDITDSIDESSFVWIRNSIDKFSDAAWNSSSKAIGQKSINLTPDDVRSRADFRCVVDI